MRHLFAWKLIPAACLLCLATLLAAPSTLHAQSFCSIAAGNRHSLGVKTDGSLWTWGLGDRGQLGLGYLIYRYYTMHEVAPTCIGEGFAAVAAGESFSLGLKTDGSLWAWGQNSQGQLGIGTIDSYKDAPVRVGEDFTVIAAGLRHSLGLKTDGSLWAWGQNVAGTLGVDTTEDTTIPVQVAEGFAAISAGFAFSLGLKTDGSLWTWGRNDYGQMGDGTTNDGDTPVQVGDGFIAIAAGEFHSLGLKTDGSLWAWGSNEYGQVGDGTTNNAVSPVQVGENFAAIATGWYQSFGLKTDGTLWAWGLNDYGQLGDGTKNNTSIPVQVGEGFAAISGGVDHSLGLRSDGSLWSWGYNNYGQLGDGTTTRRLSPVMVVGEAVYYVPFAPAVADFSLGFGLSNVGKVIAAEVTVDYFDNNGNELGQDTATIPANGHNPFMSSVSLAESGWARITPNVSIEGMALAFGYGEDPMFDMDFKDATATDLVAAHVDTGSGWVSKAMFANPNDAQASVTLTFHPDDGVNIQTADLSIPAMGAVQYDLATAFPDSSGAVKISSDQGLAGFLLYDGRAQGNNWLGGLSMLPLEDGASGESTYYVPFSPAESDFMLGFGLFNAGNDGTAGITVDYFDNNGNALGQDTATIAAGGHASFMSSITPAESGWARITASQPIYGMALAFGGGDDPLFDMDFKATTATVLAAAHIDTSGGWASKAMLANPNDTQANVTVKFTADDGFETQTADLAIPAMGAVQYDLATAFPDSSGAVKISSDQGLAGFLLYDGRAQGYNWLGGLSMVSSD